MTNFNILTTTDGQLFKLDGGYNYTQLHLREGYIIPTQVATTVNTSNDLLTLPVNLLVFANSLQVATGTLFLAAGQTTIEPTQYFNIFYNQRTIRFEYQYNTGVSLDTVVPNQLIGQIKVVDPTLKKVDFKCLIDLDNVMWPVIVNTQVQSNVTVYLITADTQNGIPLNINTIQRIHIGDSSTDFNYCDKGYTLNSFIS